MSPAVSKITQKDNEYVTSKAFVALLKACAKKKDMHHGIRLHADIRMKGLLENNPYLASILITMYAKCGLLTKARQVHENEIHAQTRVTWNSLISGYVDNGQGHEALNCFEKMQSDGLSPDAVTFICILKACSILGATSKVKDIHKEIIGRDMLMENAQLGTALVNAYAKCGMLKKAQQVHDELCTRDVVSWSALISAYAQHDKGEQALSCFEAMQNEGLSPNAITFTSILKACGSTGAVHKGSWIHDEIVRRGLLENNVVLGNALVGMYAKCDMLVKARKVHDELHVRDAVSWAALISGYAQQVQGQEALCCFFRMQCEGISPDGVVIIGVLSACGTVGSIDKGKQIHSMIIDSCMLDGDIVLGTSLVDMYIKCGRLAEAQQVHDELTVRNVVSWNALLVGYAEMGQGEETLDCFEQMQIEGLSPDAVTFVAILKACGSAQAIEKGEKFHRDIEKRNLLGQDPILGTTLVDMYAKCGLLVKAQQVLEQLSVRNVASWSAMIAGHAEQGKIDEALKCFKQMQSEGLCPNEITFACMLKACGNTGAFRKGMQIHDEICNRGLLDHNIVLGNALIDMYARCGVVTKAHEVHNDLQVRDVVSWSSLITGYAQQGQAHEALNCFGQMQEDHILPNAVTFISILKACGTIGAIDKGEEIHNLILSSGWLKKDVLLGTALVDMYAKCGAIERAQKVLEGLPFRNVFSWSALISAYAQKGKVQEAITCFREMQDEGHYPDEVTFLCILSACSHSGLLNEAQTCFQNMSKYYGIVPNLEHCSCVAAFLGYAGQFDKVVSVIKTMPSSVYLPIWLALLSACRKWGNVKLGCLAFDQAVQVDISCSTSYILMANIYAAAGLQEDAENIEAMRLKMLIWRREWSVLDGNEDLMQIEGAFSQKRDVLVGTC